MLYEYCVLQPEPSICSEAGLSDTMPDIAMAVPSLGGADSTGMSQLSLQDTEIELDLGDGAPHHGSMYI